MTSHQLGILLSGFLGSLLGAVIAVGALLLTLRAQRSQFRSQLRAQALDNARNLKAQREALGQQIASQSEQLAAQIAAQAREASKQRELAARADLIASIHEYHRVRGNAAWWPQVGLASRAIAVAIARWRIELQPRPEDRALWDELQWWPEPLERAQIGPQLDRTVAAFLHAPMNLGAGHGNAVLSSEIVAGILRGVRDGLPPRQ